MKKINLKKAVYVTASLSVMLLLIFAEPAFAEDVGGLEKVNSFMTNILGILRGASISVVTISIIWAGYKFLFKQGDLGECTKILAGGLLIGGATEIAGYLLGKS
jgi:type IV secretory pathway VirB2 component (pilin)